MGSSDGSSKTTVKQIESDEDMTGPALLNNARVQHSELKVTCRGRGNAVAEPQSGMATNSETDALIELLVQLKVRRNMGHIFVFLLTADRKLWARCQIRPKCC